MLSTTDPNEKRARIGELEEVDGSRDGQDHGPDPGNRAWIRAQCDTGEVEQ